MNLYRRNQLIQMTLSLYAVGLAVLLFVQLLRMVIGPNVTHSDIPVLDKENLGRVREELSSDRSAPSLPLPQATSSASLFFGKLEPFR